MIISLQHRYIFVHAPKTGGTALTLALEERLGKDDIVIGDTPKAQKRKRRLKGVETPGRLWKHSSLRDIDGLVPAKDLDDFFIFMLVRNPWDRMVSYYHWLKDQNFDHTAVALAKELSFADFVGHPTTSSSFQNSSADTYLCDINGAVRAAHFVRLEYLKTDLKPVEEHLGFPLGPIDKVNASQRDRDYQPYYTDLTKRQVARMCESDIIRFGYTF